MIASRLLWAARCRNVKRFRQAQPGRQNRRSGSAAARATDAFSFVNNQRLRNFRGRFIMRDYASYRHSSTSYYSRMDGNHPRYRRHISSDPSHNTLSSARCILFFKKLEAVSYMASCQYTLRSVYHQLGMPSRPDGLAENSIHRNALVDNWDIRHILRSFPLCKNRDANGCCIGFYFSMADENCCNISCLFTRSDRRITF